MTYNAGYGIDSIPADKLEYTIDGGTHWKPLNIGHPINNNERHKFSVPVSSGNAVNFRHTANGTVQLNLAVVNYNVPPIR